MRRVVFFNGEETGGGDFPPRSTGPPRAALRVANTRTSQNAFLSMEK